MSKLSLPLVSCIIPTKNRPELVIRAIRSVLEQTHQKMQIIVIDDSSNTDTMHALSSFKNVIHYIKNQKRRGACYSRNIGINEAKGDIISFLDDDDYWLPNKIERQLKLLNHYALVGCNSLTSINRKSHYIQRPSRVSYEEMLYHNYLGSCSYVVVTSNAIDGCFFDENLESSQDWDMWLNILKSKNISEAANVNEYLVNYNSGLHSRITNTVDAGKTAMILYAKYAKDHTADSTRKFFMYNMIRAENSFLLWLFREFLKVRSKQKGMIFMLSVIIKKMFRKTVLF